MNLTLNTMIHIGGINLGNCLLFYFFSFFVSVFVRKVVGKLPFLGSWLVGYYLISVIVITGTLLKYLLSYTSPVFWFGWGALTPFLYQGWIQWREKPDESIFGFIGGIVGCLFWSVMLVWKYLWHTIKIFFYVLPVSLYKALRSAPVHKVDWFGELRVLFSSYRSDTNDCESRPSSIAASSDAFWSKKREGVTQEAIPPKKDESEVQRSGVIYNLKPRQRKGQAESSSEELAQSNEEVLESVVDSLSEAEQEIISAASWSYYMQYKESVFDEVQYPYDPSEKRFTLATDVREVIGVAPGASRETLMESIAQLREKYTKYLHVGYSVIIQNRAKAILTAIEFAEAELI